MPTGQRAQDRSPERGGGQRSPEGSHPHPHLPMRNPGTRLIKDRGRVTPSTMAEVGFGLSPPCSQARLWSAATWGYTPGLPHPSCRATLSRGVFIPTTTPPACLRAHLARCPGPGLPASAWVRLAALTSRAQHTCGVREHHQPRPGLPKAGRTVTMTSALERAPGPKPCQEASREPRSPSRQLPKSSDPGSGEQPGGPAPPWASTALHSG